MFPGSYWFEPVTTKMDSYTYPLMDYPIAQVLGGYKSQTSFEGATAGSSDTSTTTLAKLDKVPVSGYLKELVSELRDYPKSLKKMGEVRELIQMKTPQQLSIQDALMFLNQILLQSNKFLQNINHTLESSSEIIDENIQCLEPLKKAMSEFTHFLDQILLHYADMSIVTELPFFEEVKNSKAALEKNIDLVTSQIWPEYNSQISQEEVLCSIIGLQFRIASRLENLTSLVRSHQSDRYFVLRFLTNNCQMIKIDINLACKNAVAAKLLQIGFTESRSRVMARWITQQPWCKHQSLLSWTQLYIWNVFQYNIFLSDYVSKYPYHEEVLHDWFPVIVPLEIEEEDEVITKETQVPFINTTPQSAPEVLSTKSSEVGYGLWFHATDHKSAVEIVMDGINPGCGRLDCDFSQGYGFYLTRDSKHALAWAMKSKAAAIVLYKLSDDLLSHFKCLDLGSDQVAWKDIVKFHRGDGRKERLPKDLKIQCKECDYIQGPMSGNGAEDDEQSWEPLGFQICVKSKRMAEFVGNPENVHGVVFVNSPN